MSRGRTSAQARRLRAGNRAGGTNTREKPKPFGKRLRSWLSKPLVWVGLALVAGVGAFIGHYVESVLGSLIPDWAPGDPVRVVDVRRDEAEIQPYVVPAAKVDDQWVSALSAGEPAVLVPPPDGAVSVGRMTWQIVLEGNRPNGVIVTDIRPALLEPCRVPAQGAYVETRSQGEGPRTHLYTVIDKEPPVFYEESPVDPADGGIGSPGTKFFAEHYISLAPGEQYPISITALATDKYCRWNLEVEISSDQKITTLTIPGPGGSPFELTAPRTDLSTYDGVVLPDCETWTDFTYVTGDHLNEQPTPSDCLTEE
ncbi:hypothetical protein [Promicromonospora sp. NPDC057488]|uniref:hypothetical protein n=1 Tax=Promicromonospora sp. NPDC057488 TaxID=3346147 RepID=UPI00367353DF